MKSWLELPRKYTLNRLTLKLRLQLKRQVARSIEVEAQTGDVSGIEVDSGVGIAVGVAVGTGAGVVIEVGVGVRH